MTGSKLVQQRLSPGCDETTPGLTFNDPNTDSADKAGDEAALVEDPTAPLIIGVDIARQGVDQSVIRFRRGLDARDTGREVPRIPGEIRRLIRKMSLANPL